METALEFPIKPKSPNAISQKITHLLLLINPFSQVVSKLVIQFLKLNPPLFPKKSFTFLPTFLCIKYAKLR